MSREEDVLEKRTLFQRTPRQAQVMRRLEMKRAFGQQEERMSAGELGDWDCWRPKYSQNSLLYASVNQDPAA